MNLFILFFSSFCKSLVRVVTRGLDMAIPTVLPLTFEKAFCSTSKIIAYIVTLIYCKIIVALTKHLAFECGTVVKEEKSLQVDRVRRDGLPEILAAQKKPVSATPLLWGEWKEKTAALFQFPRNFLRGSFFTNILPWSLPETRFEENSTYRSIITINNNELITGFLKYKVNNVDFFSSRGDSLFQCDLDWIWISESVNRSNVTRIDSTNHLRIPIFICIYKKKNVFNTSQ